MEVKVKISKEERAEAKEYVKKMLPKYLEREGIDPNRNFPCLSPEHDDNHGDMSYHRPSNTCVCHCGARYDTFDLIGVEYGLTGFNEQFNKACEIFGLFGMEEDETSVKVPANWREINPLEGYEIPEKACDEKCSRAYLALSRVPSTKLKDEHRDDLLRRGLSEKDIKEFRFCSMPDNPQKATGEVIEKVGFELGEVPGFYLGNRTWEMIRDVGYLCPAWDGERNLIPGCQINRGVEQKKETSGGKKKGPKYVWLSSSRKSMGASSGAISTILPGQNTKKWIVTEGILKATVIYCLLDRKISVIGVPGVGTIGGFKQFMEERLDKDILFIEAYDMDKLEAKKEVKKAWQSLLKTIDDYGFKVHPLTWDTDKDGHWKGSFKGLDDFLLDYKKQGKIDKFLRYIESL